VDGTLQAEVVALKRVVRHIYQNLDELSSRLARIDRVTQLSPEAEFRAVFPDSVVDPELFELVGVQPLATIEEDKEVAREMLSRKFGK
jgi:hypothetical protein